MYIKDAIHPHLPFLFQKICPPNISLTHYHSPSSNLLLVAAFISLLSVSKKSMSSGRLKKYRAFSRTLCCKLDICGQVMLVRVLYTLDTPLSLIHHSLLEFFQSTLFAMKPTEFEDYVLFLYLICPVPQWSFWSGWWGTLFPCFPIVLLCCHPVVLTSDVDYEWPIKPMLCRHGPLLSPLGNCSKKIACIHSLLEYMQVHWKWRQRVCSRKNGNFDLGLY